MFQISNVIIRRIYLLIALPLMFGHVAAAESEKDFAKCHKMASKHASWLLKKGSKAREDHDQHVRSLIAKHASGRPDSEQEEKRMTAIIDRLVEEYQPQEFWQILIDEAAEKVLSAENDEDFTCWRKPVVNSGFRRNLRRYEDNLEKIEDAIVERLDLEQLDADEGLVVILFNASGYAQNVVINRLGAIGGGIRFGPVNDADYFRVQKVKAGQYRWESIWNKTWLGRVTSHIKNRDFEFTVEPGKLNYTGAFVYKTEFFSRYSVNLLDRTSVVLSLLEDRYPELLNTFEINNGLNSDNRFIEFHRREKLAARAEDDDA